VVYSPEFIDGLSLTLDWYRIEIANAVGSYSAQRVFDGCYKEGDAKYCQLLTRDKTGALNGNIGEVDYMALTNQNFKGGSHVEGVDLNIDYRFTTDYGTWRINNDNAYVIYDGSLGKLKRGELTLDGSLSGGNSSGRLTAGASGGGTAYRLKSNTTLTWSKDDWNASVTAQYLGKLTEECNLVIGVANGLKQPALKNLCSNPDGTRMGYTLVNGQPVEKPNEAWATNELKATVYFDGQIGWTSPWNSDISVGVRNIFDKEPPVAYSAFANSFDPNYRTPGRFYYVSFTQKF
jgi:iron complex outermembrane receptor protein